MKMEKRIYIILFCVLCISVVLLGFSFSKDSGTKDLSFLKENDNEEFRVVYSKSNEIDTINDSEITLAIINKSDSSNEFVVNLVENNNNVYNDVFYTINDGPEFKLSDNKIILGSLNKYGTDGDFDTFKLNIYTKNNVKYSFKIDVSINDVFTLNDAINISDGVYIDVDDNIRYYGENPNNYIKYNDDIFRIVGIIDNKVKILSDSLGLGFYTDNSNYLSLNDYLRSYNNTNVDKDNVLDYNSWITSDSFWLVDLEENSAYYCSDTFGVGKSTKYVNYNIRYVYTLDKDLVVSDGNGSESSPYEVTYGS